MLPENDKVEDYTNKCVIELVEALTEKKFSYDVIAQIVSNVYQGCGYKNK